MNTLQTPSMETLQFLDSYHEFLHSWQELEGCYDRSLSKLLQFKPDLSGGSQMFTRKEPAQKEPASVSDLESLHHENIALKREISILRGINKDLKAHLNTHILIDRISQEHTRMETRIEVANMPLLSFIKWRRKYRTEAR